MLLAHESGYFKEELAPVTVSIKKKEIVVDVDEHPRPETTLDKLNKLPSLFAKDGVVTAGTASVRKSFFALPQVSRKYKTMIFFLGHL